MTVPLEVKLQISCGVFGIGKARCYYEKGVATRPDECGEDSFCIADTEKRLVLGVADGVSGSKDDGGNPAAFARLLMHHSSEIAKSEPKKFKAHKVLEEVFEKIVAAKDEKLAKGASSTACLLSINKKSGQLRYGNLGDSGFVILSPNEEGTYKVVFKSEYQLYEFNFPYQFSIYSDGEVERESLKKIGKNTRKLVLKAGDVVLLMTDGVFDNLYDAELEKHTTIVMKSSKSAQQLAENIGVSARIRGNDPDADTPFADGLKECGKEPSGGKPDDVTVIVAIIKSDK